MNRLGDSEEDDRQIRDDAETHWDSGDAAVARDAKIALALEYMDGALDALTEEPDGCRIYIGAAITVLQELDA